MADDRSPLSKELLTDSDAMVNLPTFYANASQLILTPEDGCIVFCQRDIENANNIHAKVRVYAPLAHLKRIWEGLGQSILNYEKTFGVIHTDARELLTPEAKKLYESEMKENEEDNGS